MDQKLVCSPSIYLFRSLLVSLHIRTVHNVCILYICTIICTYNVQYICAYCVCNICMYLLCTYVRMYCQYRTVTYIHLCTYFYPCHSVPCTQYVCTIVYMCSTSALNIVYTLEYNIICIAGNFYNFIFTFHDFV